MPHNTVCTLPNTEYTVYTLKYIIHTSNKYTSDHCLALSLTKPVVESFLTLGDAEANTKFVDVVADIDIGVEGSISDSSK